MFTVSFSSLSSPFSPNDDNRWSHHTGNDDTKSACATDDIDDNWATKVQLQPIQRRRRRRRNKAFLPLLAYTVHVTTLLLGVENESSNVPVFAPPP